MAAARRQAPLSDWDPFPPPQWRADRVAQLIDQSAGSPRLRRWDDHYVRVYWQLLRALLTAGDAPQLEPFVKPVWADVYQAHQLHFQPNRAGRDILQARLLSREPNSNIAERYGVTPEAIDFYEKLFFNVSERLTASDWIAKILRDMLENAAWLPSGSMSESLWAAVYCWFGYYGGPQALDAVIAAGWLQSSPPLVAARAGYFEDSFRHAIRIRAIIAALLQPGNQTNALAMLKLEVKRQRGSTVRANRQAKPLEVSGNIEAFLKQTCVPPLRPTGTPTPGQPGNG